MTNKTAQELQEFKVWLNDYRGFPVSHVFHEINVKYAALLDRIAQLEAERDKLRELAATCYAGLGGECDLPESWLDALNNAASGEAFTTDGLLPFVSPIQAELIKQTNRAASAEQQLTAMTQRYEMANAMGIEARAQLAQRQVPAKPVAWLLGCQTMGGDVGWKLSFSQSGAGVCHRLNGKEYERPLYTEQQVQAMLAASPTPPQPAADDMREPKNGKEWHVEWWNESLRMMLPSDMRLAGVKHFSSGTMTLTLKQRKAAHGIKGADDGK